MEVSLFHSFLYNVLLKTVKYREKKIFNKLWFKIFHFSTGRYTGPITTKIHGFDVLVNNGFSYPFFARLFNNYNNPLIQLVYSTSKFYDRKVSIIDVGAAIGDTNLLLVGNIPEAIEKIYCIEGDSEFHEYLNQNKKYFPKCESFNVLLGDLDEGKVNGLVKTHLGTASSLGKELVDTISLDALLFNKLNNGIDIIKIDVDGYDGKVLKGSRRIISAFKPLVIFEWHPIMMNKTGNDYYEPFEILNDLGYATFLWYNKFGFFSHFDLDGDNLNRKKMVELCINDVHEYDWHYDIIAIHKDAKIDILEIAELKKAKGKFSTF